MEDAAELAVGIPPAGLEFDGGGRRGLDRVGRLDRKMSAQEMADRAGISRPLLRRIENADPGCAIGSVFEVAVIAGVPLWGGEPDRLESQRSALSEKLSLLPQRARKPRRIIHDDF